MKKSYFLRIGILLLCFFVFVSCVACSRKTEQTATGVFTTEVSSLKANVFTTKYGNLYTSSKGLALFDAGFEWGDVICVSFLDRNVVMPLAPDFSYVDSDEPVAVVIKNAGSEPEGYLLFAINMGDFTTAYGIATKTVNADSSWFWTANDGVEFPLEFRITMVEKAGYLSEYLMRDLIRTNNRKDYANLTDEEFANFRKVSTTGMHNLYRTSNPINSELGRNTYADEALRKAGVTVILNLSDSMEEAQSRGEYTGSYYSTCEVEYLNLGVDFLSEDFRNGLARGLRFLASEKGIYAVHCTEGKDRAGFVCALLECLMGASAEEVAKDYMISFSNYYGVTEGSGKYNAILEGNIVRTLQNAFGISDFRTADLQEGAENYIRALGLTGEEIEALKSNL